MLLARAGLASRRQAETWILAGEVSVNGKVVSELGARADPTHDHIKVRGRLLPRAREHVYFMLHKPAGVVTTMSDPEGRPCVGDIVRATGSVVVPVGRLDFHSSGLLLLTNDGDLCERLTHPRYHVDKAYRVKVRGTPGTGALERIRAGVRLDDGKTAPASVRVEHGHDGKTWLELRLHEGRNRQVRRMLEAVGLRVEKLRRTIIGPLRLGSLRAGEVRALSAKEVESLRRAVDL